MRSLGPRPKTLNYNDAKHRPAEVDILWEHVQLTSLLLDRDTVHLLVDVRYPDVRNPAVFYRERKKETKRDSVARYI